MKLSLLVGWVVVVVGLMQERVSTYTSRWSTTEKSVVLLSQLISQRASSLAQMRSLARPGHVLFRLILLFMRYIIGAHQILSIFREAPETSWRHGTFLEAWKYGVEVGIPAFGLIWIVCGQTTSSKDHLWRKYSSYRWLGALKAPCSLRLAWRCRIMRCDGLQKVLLDAQEIPGKDQ